MKSNLSYEIAEEYEWSKWRNEIPFIKFPSDWLIKIIPPFGGAIIRFRVKKIEMIEGISVYLDCYDKLGRFGEPYWEIYPGENGNNPDRYKMNDIQELLNGISKALEYLPKEEKCEK